jgi:SSS family solute:Na+ symporter
MHWIDYTIIGSYMVFAIAIGVLFSRKASKNPEAFFLGGRSMPWWAICLSMIATSFASDTPIWVTEVTRTDGLQRMWWVIIAVLPLIFGIFLFSRLWRRAGIVTDAEFYELRYDGKPAAVLRGFRAFSSGIVANLFTIGWVTFAMSTVIEVLTPFDQTEAILICMGVALFYAIFSGFYGVVATDVVQFFITMGAMLSLAIIAVYRAGGMETVLEQIRMTPGFGAKTLTIFPDFTTFNSDVIKLLVIVLLVWWNDANGYNMQRMAACRDEKDAIRATLFYAIFQSCRPWMWVVVGLVSIAIFPDLPNEEASKAYPMVINEYLGIGLKGLLITAFLAAYMSTIDTHLNWGASYLTMDVYRRFIRKEATQKHYVLMSRIFMMLLMCGGYFIVGRTDSVKGMMESLSYMLASGGIVSVLRWFWWRINAWTELTSLAGGFIGWGIYAAIGDEQIVLGQPWKDVPWEFKIGMLISVVFPLSILVTFLTKPVRREVLQEFCRRVRPGGAWGPVRKASEESGSALDKSTWFDVIGGVMLCYGLSLAIAYAILLRFDVSIAWLVVSLTGGLLVYRWYGKEVIRLRNEKARANAE